jgi:flagellar basal body rod protein FlgG
LITSESHRSLIATIDWRDLSIQGRGYLKTVDDAGENPVYVRFARLGVNPLGWLCLNLDGTLRPIDPHILIPSEWTHIAVDQQGNVTIGNQGASGQSVGQISVTLFAGDDVNESVHIRDPSERMGEPMECLPGQNGAGLLMQRYANQYGIAITYRTLSALALAAIAIGICARYVFPRNITPQKSITA